MNLRNFSRGLYRVDIPPLGAPTRGKVRDNWIVRRQNTTVRVQVTTDRQAVAAHPICTIPGKGQISNLISAFWFERTKDVVPNHMLAIPHPNVLIAKQAIAVIPIEFVLRRYMARGYSETSVCRNYLERGRREIYGIRFPEGLRADQEFPMGTILTPTTKAADGIDRELTQSEAKKIADRQFGAGTWSTASRMAHVVFERARTYCLERGILLADTKFEFGIDESGELMLIDEVLTPEGSRLWVADTYQEFFEKGNTQQFDKDVLVRWLRAHGNAAADALPTIDSDTIDRMARAYSEPYRRITGKALPSPTRDPRAIPLAVWEYLEHAY